MNQNLKTYLGFGVLSALMVVSLFAQANLEVPPLPPEGQANIFTAMYDTIIHNPSSLFVLIVLCVVAWLMDELPFIDSKFVTHYTALIGGSIYWMFCHPANVPKSFPYAWPVLACIGVVCGFVAGILHKQIIGRIIEYLRAKIPGSDPKPTDQKNVPPLGVWLVLGLTAALTCTGCRHLAPDGPYKGDTVLYQAETTIVTSYQLVDTFLQWERTNTKLLTKWPEIHRAAEQLRRDYPQWYRTANALRDAYAANPDPATRDKLQTALALLRTALTEAAGYMAQATTPN